MRHVIIATSWGEGSRKIRAGDVLSGDPQADALHQVIVVWARWHVLAALDLRRMSALDSAAN